MMWPYFVMVGVPAFVSIVGYNLSDRRLRNRLVLASFFLIWLVLLCFRKESVGVDTNNYHLLFNTVSKMSFNDIFAKAFRMEIEFAYYFLLKLLTLITSDFRVIIVFHALASLIPLWFLYRNNALQNSYLTIVIFLSLGLFGIYFSAFRQVLAMTFMVPAYYFTRNKKLLLFLLMVLLAFNFHHSAIIMALLYPIYHLNLRFNTSLLIVVPFIVLVYFFREPIFSWLSAFFGSMYTGTIKSTGAIMVFLLLAIFSVFCYIMPSGEFLDKDTVGLRNLLLLCTVLQIFAGINTLAMRLNYYYLIFVPILIPRIINSSRESNRKVSEIAYIVMVAFFTFWFFRQAYVSSDILHVFPFYPAWAI